MRKTAKSVKFASGDRPKPKSPISVSTASVKAAENDHLIRKPPKVESLCNGAMESRARGATEFGHLWQDNTSIALGDTRPTLDPCQELKSIKGHELNLAVGLITLLPYHVQVILHLRHEIGIPDDSMDDASSYKFIRMLRALDFVVGVSHQRVYHLLEVATQLSAAEQTIGLGALKNPKEKCFQYRTFCDPRGSRSGRHVRMVHYVQFRNIELAHQIISEELKSISKLPELNATPGEMFECLKDVRESYTVAQEVRDGLIKAKIDTARASRKRRKHESNIAAET